jgi:hypothetical protein
VSGRSCDIASRRRRSIDGLIDRQKAWTAIHCGIEPDNVQQRINYGNSRYKATSRTLQVSSGLFSVSSGLFSVSSGLFQVSSGLSKPLQDFSKALQNLPLHSVGFSRSFTTSPAPPCGVATGHRAGQGGGEPRLRKSFARLLLTCNTCQQPRTASIRRRRRKPSEERPVLYCTAPCEVPESGKPPLYQDQYMLYYPHIYASFSPIPHHDLDN